VWSRMVVCSKHNDEMEWLSKNVYNGKNRATVALVDSSKRFAEI